MNDGVVVTHTKTLMRLILCTQNSDRAQEVDVKRIMY